MIEILLVDDHAIVREGLRRIIDDTSENFSGKIKNRRLKVNFDFIFYLILRERGR